MGKKLKLSGLLATLAALASLAVAGPAAAGKQGDPFEAGDPLTTNIPYVAYAGSEVRLVKCFPLGELRGDAEWQVVDWSGVNPDGQNGRDPVFFDDVDKRTPSFAGSRGSVLSDQAGRTCWAIDVESQKPGMAVIKMATDILDPPSGAPEIKHQFLVIWLKMNNPVLEELADADFPGISLGDPLGDGNFLPNVPDAGAFGEGLIRVTVDGSFPLGQNFSDDLDGNADVDTVVLPRDWALLADHYAVSINGRDPASWDIHDDQAETEDHTDASFCNDKLGADIDAVDNCLGGNEIGSFSRLVGGTSPITLGPFDPVRPSSSYLPDGKVDAGDAPMPAAPVTVTVGGAFGALASADKHVLYSRDRTGADDPHNLYAPFYAALIPPSSFALASALTISGVNGAIANNFPGFQPFPGVLSLYHYWDLLNTHSLDEENECNDVGGTGQYRYDRESGAILARQGVDRATVYTDEHGEAIVTFLPDTGVELAADLNGLCDPGEISSTPRRIATATISAEADDPFQPVFDSRRLAVPLTKNLFSLAGKSLDCHPKTPLIAICVETILDRFGKPVVGAPVIFTADATEGDPNVIGLERSIDVPGTGFNDDPGPQCFGSPADTFGLFEGTLCYTNREGQAAVEVLTSHATLVDVIAENAGTRNGGFGILRDRCVRFFGDGQTLPTDGPSCVTPTTPAPPAGGTGGTGNTGNTGNQGNTSNQGGAPAVAATVVSLAGNPVPSAAPKPAVKTPAVKAKATKLASARLVFKNGQRYLVVRANGSAKSAKVRITLVMRTGKTMKPVVRTIRTNRAVRVANLVVGKHVRTVRVSVLR